MTPVVYQMTRLTLFATFAAVLLAAFTGNVSRLLPGPTSLTDVAITVLVLTLMIKITDYRLRAWQKKKNPPDNLPSRRIPATYVYHACYTLTLGFFLMVLVYDLR